MCISLKAGGVQINLLEKYIENTKNIFWKKIRYVQFILCKFACYTQLFFRKSEGKLGTAHILAMGKIEYSRMALFCAATFIRFNSNYKVIIHCDSEALTILKNHYLADWNLVEVCACLSVNDDPYRKQLEFIGKLQGTFDFLMDADLWWLGTVDKCNIPLTFDIENKIESHRLMAISKQVVQDFLVSKSLPKIAGDRCVFMMTACFTAWNGTTAAFESDILLKLYDEVRENLILNGYHESVRLSGQIVVSYVYSTLGSFSSISQLQSIHNRKLMKSSFFGATGYMYGE